MEAMTRPDLVRSNLEFVDAWTPRQWNRGARIREWLNPHCLARSSVTLMWLLLMVFISMMLLASGAHAALSEYRIAFEPSSDTTTIGYTLHIGEAPGNYSNEFDLGSPPSQGGTIVYAVDLEDTTDLYVSLRAYDDRGAASNFSNEIRVSAVAAPPPPPGGGDDSSGGDPPPQGDGSGDDGTGDGGSGGDGNNDGGDGSDTGDGSGGDGGNGSGEDPPNDAPDDPSDPDLGLAGVGLSTDGDGVIKRLSMDGRLSDVLVDSLAGDRNLRPSGCDLDGDGDGDLVIGYGPGSGGEVAIVEMEAGEVVGIESILAGTAAYRKSSGATFPACGDVDGDGLAEIVVGFDEGITGHVQLFDDAETGYDFMREFTDEDGLFALATPRRYRRLGGATHPALGDVDGDGRDELIVGLGASAKGRILILDDAMGEFKAHSASGHRKGWAKVVPGTSFERNYAETLPSLGDVDGDGLDEIAIGFGAGSDGRVVILDDARNGFIAPDQPIFHFYPGRAAYRDADGEMRPALGDIDDDGIDEIVVGFARESQHELQVFDDMTKEMKPMVGDDGFVPGTEAGDSLMACPMKETL